jgi:hypothetical protein
MQQQAEQADLQRQFQAQENDLQRRSALVQRQLELAAAAGDKAQERQYQAQQAELQRQFEQLLQNQRISAGQYAGSTPQPSSNTSDLATNTFIVQLDQAPDKQSAIDAFNAAMDDGTFADAYADPLKIWDAINKKDWGGGLFGGWSPWSD